MELSTIAEAAIQANTEARWAEEAAKDAEGCLAYLEARQRELDANVGSAKDAVKKARHGANEAIGIAQMVVDANSLEEARDHAKRVFGCRAQVENNRQRVHEAIFA